jgi:hypothetical protein
MILMGGKNMQMVIAISVLIGLGAPVLVLLVRRMTAVDGTLPVTAEWINALSLERYRPMMRLLDSEDLEFLKSQPGFTPRMASRVRVQRAQIFRGYLRCLCSDFSRICAAVKVLMTQSRHDRPDLAGMLVQHRVLFTIELVAVYLRLYFYQVGLGSVDVSDLVKSFETMRVELRNLVPAAVGAAA